MLYTLKKQNFVVKKLSQINNQYKMLSTASNLRKLHCAGIFMIL